MNVVMELQLWSGKLKETVRRTNIFAPKCHSSHCVLHRYALVSERVPLELKQVLNEAVCIVNYIKSRPLKSRLKKKNVKKWVVSIIYCFFTLKSDGFQEERF